MEGSFVEENFCNCLTSAFDHAVLMGERITDCMLFGESIHNRLQICETDCEIIYVDDKKASMFSGNWIRQNDTYGTYRNKDVQVWNFMLNTNIKN